MNEQAGVSGFGFTNGCSKQLAPNSATAKLTRHKSLGYDNERIMALIGVEFAEYAIGAQFMAYGRNDDIFAHFNNG